MVRKCKCRSPEVIALALFLFVQSWKINCS
nr:MAG TPA: hypothetical protein [Caudoviricetes sp.]